MIAMEIGGRPFFPDALHLEGGEFPQMPGHERVPFTDGFLERVSIEMQRRRIKWPDVTFVTDRLVGKKALAPFLLRAKVVLLRTDATRMLRRPATIA